MTPAKRLDVVKEHKLCFNCLNYSNHSAKFCKQSSKCNIDNCKMRHSKLLHTSFLVKKDGSQKSETQSQHYVNMLPTSENKVEANSSACGGLENGTSKVSLPIVTVLVRGKGQSDFVRTNALLDPGSNKTFCSVELVNQLGISGQPASLNLKTLNDGKDMLVEEVCLEVMSTVGKRKCREILCLPKVYALNDFPELQGSVATSADVYRWNHLNDVSVPHRQNVSLLIGQDVPKGLMPIEVRRGKDGEPYAIKTVLGWTINGPLGNISEDLHMASACHFVYGKSDSDISLEARVERFWSIDTGQVLAGSVPELSVDDRRVLKVWNDTIKLKEGHYELSIPFTDECPNLPDNKSLALKRLLYLKKRLSKDTDLHKRYTEEVNKLFDKGYAECIPSTCNTEEEKLWYLPHHAVSNPNKPDKLRVVFDCAAECKNTSLNKNVSQGPDLANKLLGVLLRFRERNIALMADIEAMFYQVKVPPQDRDVLRFLWWQNGDLTQEPTVYRMTVHPFGGVWSPSCTNFALRHTAEANAASFDPETVHTVLNNFYVDDCLKSVDGEERAIKLVRELIHITSLGGFRLTKWVSNNDAVMETVPLGERVSERRNIELHCGSLPIERALGVLWNIESDTLGIKIGEKDTNYTRRSVLSVTSSVYDPLGFVCPFVLQAKKILQTECRMNKDWDDDLEDKSKKSWSKWLNELPKLKEFEMDRCLVPDSFSYAERLELHHFCDASQEAYGAVSYLRVVNCNQEIHCAFLLGKSRLAPIRKMTIPRLELSAAVLAVRVSSILGDELGLRIDRNVFWSDSMIVLQYIKNKKRRFHTFVANRVAIIHDGSSPESWRHVDGSLNPADDASRGLNVSEMVAKKRWKQGPDFLWQDESEWPELPTCSDISPDDTEVRAEAKSCAVETTVADGPIDRFLTHYSSWHRLKKAVVWLLKYKDYLRKKTVTGCISVEDLRDAEIVIFRYMQQQTFGEELSVLKSSRGKISKKSRIYALEPALERDGLLHVGGRLLSAPIADSAQHPVILPRDHYVTKLIVRHTHEIESRHSGREHVLSVLRQRYWIPKCRPLINAILRNCVTCTRLRAVSGSQKMAGLPPDRVRPGQAPFTSVGIDCFGPFYVKRGRSQEKRYGCIFTCLAMRAVHIEKLYIPLKQIPLSTR
ncbi:uncharacterized protein [Argopecten irradians]|uniref:uncharacterized protein n=1 Tax=Argopecten irradians TaxID=31199 RepID=UPI00371C86C7